MTKEQLGELIIASEDDLYRTARSLLHNDTDCADAIHEAIVKAFSGLHTLKEDRYAKTWLMRIVINECYTVMRKEKKLTFLEKMPEKEAADREDYSDLYLAVSRLPENMRLAVTLYYVEGFSIREIAMIEDTTESAVKNRLFRARVRLRELLVEEEAVGL